MSNVATNLSRAKTQLLFNYPFFGMLIMMVPIVKADDICPTMMVDGHKIYYNEEFLSKKTVDEVMFILAHEVWHLALQHVWRGGHRDPTRWNFAIDYVTNDLLVAEKIGTLPEGALHDSKLVNKGGGTAEGVYELLPHIKTIYLSSGGSGYNGTAIDECKPPSGNNPDQPSDSQMQGEWKLRVRQAADAAKMIGKLSANLDRFVSDALKPVVDWRDVLRRFITKRAKVEYTWARPKRRLIGSDIYLPSLTGESMGRMVVGVDCSGSIGNMELSAFAAEIKAIVEDVRPAEVHVLYFDAAICGDPVVFRPDDVVKLEPRGGGGTSFVPVFDHIEEHQIEPVCCIMLTDLYGTFPDEVPEYPVLWVANHDGDYDVPFGERINMIGER